MEHLREEFNDALAQEQNFRIEAGRIYIRNKYWTPEEILKGLLDPKALDDVFFDWIRERKDELIANADAILDKTGQGDRFLKLIETYKRDAVIPFVGAGLSIPSGYPGWSKFLRQQRREIDMRETDFEKLITDGKYEEVAQYISEKMKAGFNEAVESTFGCERILVGCVQYLPFVFDTCVVTTNFDDVVKRSYDNAKLPFSETIAGDQAREFPRVLGEGRRVLLKLHGKATTGKGRILTTSEYVQHYGADGFKKALRSICTRTLLFLGCSLRGDRTLSVMKEMVVENGHENIPRHYAFLPEPTTDQEKNFRRDQLLEANIYPIWYPPSEHDESLEALLAKLEEEGG
jgi:hypothetical protein